jgi:hypothetical protein
MSNTGLDEIIIDLKVIASLSQNNKLVTGGCYLNVEQPNYLLPESLRRWYRGDSRDEAVKRISSTLLKAIDKIKQDKTIIKHLKHSVLGVENLKRTYSKCTQTVARLDALIDKINTSTAELEEDN